jgi:HAD superfamily hydrolase (TIGR01509 family)
MKKSISAVVLDLGGVVFKVDWQAVLSTLEIDDPKIISLLLEVGTSLDYDSYERGKITTEEFFTLLKAKTSLDMAHTSFLHAWNSLIVEEISGVRQLLQKYSGRVPFYALSNTNAAHFDCIATRFPETVSYFKRMFTSFDLVARKPEPAIFERVQSELMLPSRELLFVDDIKENLAAARTAGWNAEFCKDSSLTLESILDRYLPDPGHQH